VFWHGACRTDLSEARLAQPISCRFSAGLLDYAVRAASFIGMWVVMMVLKVFNDFKLYG